MKKHELGLKVMRNQIGIAHSVGIDITPSEYLSNNPRSNVDEVKIEKHSYVLYLYMMGEIEKVRMMIVPYL